MLGDSLFEVFEELSEVLPANAQPVVVGVVIPLLSSFPPGTCFLERRKNCRGRTTVSSGGTVGCIQHRMLQPQLLEVPHGADERTSPESSPLHARSTLTAATDRTRTRTSTQEVR